MVKGKQRFLSIPGIVFLMLTLKIVTGSNINTPSPIARPNCVDKCGNISIPFPFGIGKGCHYEPELDEYGRTYIYNMSCDDNSNPPILNYGRDIQVVNITLEGEFRILNNVSYICYNFSSNSSMPYAKYNGGMNMRRFTLSTAQNYVGAIGCDTYVWLNGTMKDEKKFRSGCMTVCDALPEDTLSNTCAGNGCCLVSIPSAVTNIDLKVHSFNDQYVQSFNPCSVAFMVAKDHKDADDDSFPFSISKVMNETSDTFQKGLNFPVVYDWSIGNKRCKDAQASGEQILCKGNSRCIDWVQGYRCQCNPGFQSTNAYLYDCQDIDECANAKENQNQQLCPDNAECVNTVGNYNCICLPGFSHPSGRSNSDLCISTKNRKELPLEIKIVGGVGAGIIVSLIAGLWFHWHHGNRKLLLMKERHFRQNGGNILLEKLSQRDVSVSNMVQMFTFEELKKATNNYSESSIIGQGGFGMVYKGTLLPNNQVVAIKRSLKVDSTQIEPFINEIVALSQINNKNVVKLIGCCLETEVPLLVYEYINNGTLYDHLHDERKPHFLAWDIRLRIAVEVSQVLAYLHTTICVPIIHRDIKSANILLDKDYTAKVADFGASKLAPIDREQLATMVQGTCGYLDPEYMQTGELTEKSDVYSFGVVLVELITGEKAICYAKPENERSLAVCFLRKLKEDRLLEIVDENIKSSEGGFEQVKAVAYVAKRCLKLKGEDRPSMREIARELEKMSDLVAHPLLNEESEYLLGETQMEINHSYGDNEATDDPLTTQSSRVVQLVPLNDGR